jgi:hypothetical protein
MYDPGVPAGCTKAIEADYQAVYAEWQKAQPALVDKRAVTIADSRVPQWFKDWLT